MARKLSAKENRRILSNAHEDEDRDLFRVPLLGWLIDTGDSEDGPWDLFDIHRRPDRGNKKDKE